MPNFSNMYTGEQPFRDDFSSVFLRKTQDADLSGPYVFFGPSALKKLLTLGTGFTREGYSRSLEQSDKLVSQYLHVFSCVVFKNRCHCSIVEFSSKSKSN
uniref:Uncharacterized protein n=1 Tax=Cacopsylla melanoneura TaxID=428564 RepID=A0A8D8WM92_9HEMI